MKISEGQKARMRELDNKLLASIKSHTNLEIREIRDLEMEKLEKKIGIKSVETRIYFSWENSEKEGWQNSKKFVDEDKLAVRERQIDLELRRWGF